MNNDEAIKLVEEINFSNDLTNGIVLFLRSGLEESIERKLTDAEWDSLSQTIFESAWYAANDFMYEIQ